eukprot:1159058-Pelagomonas_calceolata.AAC.8
MAGLCMVYMRVHVCTCWRGREKGRRQVRHEDFWQCQICRLSWHAPDFKQSLIYDDKSFSFTSWGPRHILVCLLPLGNEGLLHFFQRRQEVCCSVHHSLICSVALWWRGLPALWGRRASSFFTNVVALHCAGRLGKETESTWQSQCANLPRECADLFASARASSPHTVQGELCFCEPLSTLITSEGTFVLPATGAVWGSSSHTVEGKLRLCGPVTTFTTLASR